MNKKDGIILLLILVIVVIVAPSLKSMEPGDDFVSQLPIPHFWDVSRINYALSESPYDKELQKDFLIDLEGKEKLPKFEDFPAVSFSDNQNIIVDINSNPVGREFRTAIRYGAEKFGINFAGKYSVAEWGCGTSCQSGAIIDADTGHVYPLPNIMSNGLDTRKDSRLLIQNPIIVGGDWPRETYRMIYWEWTGQGLKLLGVYRVDLVKKEIVEVKEDYAYYSSRVNK